MTCACTHTPTSVEEMKTLSHDLFLWQSLVTRLKTIIIWLKHNPRGTSFRLIQTYSVHFLNVAERVCLLYLWSNLQSDTVTDLESGQGFITNKILKTDKRMWESASPDITGSFKTNGTPLETQMNTNKHTNAVSAGVLVLFILTHCA